MDSSSRRELVIQLAKGDANMVRLEDGTEIDLEELKRKVMTI